MSTGDPSMGLVILMGLGTVFFGLICIIAICYAMGAIIKLIEGKKPVAEPTPAAPVNEAAAPEINKGELIAVVSAVIAEELGESAEAIRIKSIRKVS